jgi:hypothetical protein
MNLSNKDKIVNDIKEKEQLGKLVKSRLIVIICNK